MTAQFTPRDEVQWKTVRFLERPDESFEYEFELPEPLASWDVFAAWERERFASMRDSLTHGDVLFDIGTEQGWCNLLYAQFVGPGNMVLIEPTCEFWPNIEATWHRNYSVDPLACYDGLFSNITNDDCSEFVGVWPILCVHDLIDRNKYQYIHEHEAGTPQMRLDDFVARSGITPSALTMDVEGAELLVLQGAEATLREHHPKTWVSIHPDLMGQHYGTTPEQVHAFMDSLGYTGEFIAQDHETHYFYSPNAGG